MQISQQAKERINNMKKLFCKKSLKDCKSYPKELEEQIGVKGISHDYKMPNNVSQKEYELDFFNKYAIYNIAEKNLSKVKQAKAQKQPSNEEQNFLKAFGKEQDIEAYEFLQSQKQGKTKELNQKVAELKNLNPELKKVKVNENSFSESFDFIHGATTGFSPEDIHFYINATQQEKQKQSSKAQQFAKENGIKINYAPSEKTLGLIKEKLEQKKKPQKQASFDAYQEFLKSRGHFEY